MVSQGTFLVWTLRKETNSVLSQKGFVAIKACAESEYKRVGVKLNLLGAACSLIDTHVKHWIFFYVCYVHRQTKSTKGEMRLRRLVFNNWRFFFLSKDFALYWLYNELRMPSGVAAYRKRRQWTIPSPPQKRVSKYNRIANNLVRHIDHQYMLAACQRHPVQMHCLTVLPSKFRGPVVFAISTSSCLHHVSCCLVRCTCVVGLLFTYLWKEARDMIRVTGASWEGEKGAGWERERKREKERERERKREKERERMRERDRERE